MAKAKPFIKWVGGKSQLIEQLDAQLPADFDNWNDATYIEPFVGGGAMLFYMLQRYPNITSAVINDVNPDLTTCYRTVRDNPEELIESLRDIQNNYYALRSEEARKEFFLAVRDRYNEKNLEPIENTTKFFFLNRTCFNGLYRVNKRGLFNVPFGKYANPQICDETTIRLDSRLLNRVEILTGDFEETFNYAQGNTLFYFDPPYRPLSDTSSFNDYAKEPFNDDAQIRLKEYCDRINEAGFSFMLSNSDCKGKNEADNFFDVLYGAYEIERVWASRSINSIPSKRGKLTEILVHNYKETRANSFAENFHLEVMGVAEEEFEHKYSNKNNMAKDFRAFMSQLQTSIVHFDYFCDFDKVRRNVSAIEIKLNTLNYLIGKSDLLKAIKELWSVNPEVFDIIEILIAVRSKDKKSVADENSNPVLLSKYLESPESIFELMTKTGIAEVICNKEVKNLVDYVFGVEVGMDTNARKNRGGKIMENAVAKLFDQGGVKYSTQFPSKKIPIVQRVLGKDKKVFDFVVETKAKTYLIEVNFFGDEGGGSKLNEVARSFDGTAARINTLSDYEFVWITDGTSWFAAEDKLEEAYNNIPKLYNLTSIQEFIKLVKDDK